MLKSVKITLSLPEEQKIHSSMGSIMHGALMEQLPTETAETLHSAGLRPYSQSVYFDKISQTPVWRINILSRNAEEKILQPILSQESLFLRQKKYPVFLQNKERIADTSYESLADEIFQREEVPNGVNIHFQTVTSFKREGKYVLIPEVYLIFQSLISRWNAFSSSSKLIEDDFDKKLASCVRIIRYNLHTQSFSLEHQMIVGFSGTMGFKFYGNVMIRRLMGLLMLFAPFAGVGIKTALGMGAVDTELFYKNKGAM